MILYGFILLTELSTARCRHPKPGSLPKIFRETSILNLGVLSHEIFETLRFAPRLIGNNETVRLEQTNNLII